MKRWFQWTAAALSAFVIAAVAQAQSATGVVISQFAVRGPLGGNDEFVEIYNASPSAVAIGGWTLQGCASASPGTASIRATVPANTNLLPGRYYLFANNVAGTGYSLAVAPDAVYGTGFTDFTTAGFSGIRLVSSSSVTAPAVDGVGSGASPCREGTGIVTTVVNGATAYPRRTVGNVVQDANNNATDFPAIATSNPRNSASPANGGGGTPSVSLSLSPASFNETGGSAAVTATLSATSTQAVTVNLTFSGSAVNGVNYAPSASSIGIAPGLSTGSITLNGIHDNVYTGDQTVTVTLGTLTNAVAGTPNNVTATILENDPQPPPVIGARIYEIQGGGHVSPMNNQAVSNVPGIVTAVASNGFYMQDGDGDGNVNTSDGMFVFTSSPPGVSVGREVLVNGTVSEFRPNGAIDLGVTEIVSPTLTPYGGNSLFTNNGITPALIGAGGRVPPTDIIDNDTLGNIETSFTTIFDPAEDGIDFYETLESMLVRIDNPVLTSPTLASGASGDRQYFVLADFGAGATGRNLRGGVTLVERAAGVDYNPERIELFTGLPGTNAPNGTVFDVGDTLAGPITGVMSYFDNFEVLPLAAPVVASAANNVPTVTRIATGANRLTVAAFNIENYDPNDPLARRCALAAQIVNNLHAPDIVSLGEVQDNNGATNNGVVAADVTLQTLIDAIVAAGGPTYSYQQINPAAGNPDGGEPGGNIRVAQLYNPLRVSFVPGSSGAGDSLTPTSVNLVNGKLSLSLSPGRIDPTNAAWNSSRKPLAVTYDFNGRRVLVIGNHFNSKGGDQPLFGVNQPPLLTSEVQRRQQTQIVHDFVYNALQLDPNGRIVVLGDLNDFDFSAPLRILRNGALGPSGEEGTQPALVNLGTLLVPAPEERYSYVFQGNSQELDHILAAPNFYAASSPAYEVAHTNSEYGDQTSDHDPLLSSYLIPANVAPTASAIATPATTTSGSLVALDGSASADGDGVIASYSWTQLSGPAVSIISANAAIASFVAPTVIAPATLVFQLVVTDNDGATGTATTSVAVNPANAQPIAVDDTLSLNQDSSATVDVLANDSDPDHDPLNISTVGTPANGVAVLEGSLIRYTPNAGYTGSDAFTYSISDGRGGSASATVNVTVNDTVPNAFTFAPVTNAERNVVKTSNTITVSGITAATAISVANGSYSVNDGGYTTLPGLVDAGDTVSVQLTSAGNFATPTVATLSIGGVSAEFRVTTRNANTLPTPFSFAPVSNAPRNTRIVSQTIVVTGIEAPASISIDGGEFSINGGAFVNFVGAVVNNGDTVRVRQLSSPDFSTTTVATLTIDALSAGFSVTTEAADTTPDAFAFNAVTNAAPGSVQTSNGITVSGINTGAAIGISAGGSYSIDGGAFTSAPGTVQSGQSVVVRQTAATSFATTTVVTLSIGGVTAGFSVTTAAADATPDAFSFAPRTGVKPNAVKTSDAITVAGINTVAPISIVGGSYSVDGARFTTAAGSVSNGSRVVVRQTSAPTYNTTTTATLTIGPAGGSVSGAFDVTTRRRAKGTK